MRARRWPEDTDVSPDMPLLLPLLLLLALPKLPVVPVVPAVELPLLLLRVVPAVPLRPLLLVVVLLVPPTLFVPLAVLAPALLLLVLGLVDVPLLLVLAEVEAVPGVVAVLAALPPPEPWPGTAVLLVVPVPDGLVDIVCAWAMPQTVNAVAATMAAATLLVLINFFMV